MKHRIVWVLIVIMGSAVHLRAQSADDLKQAFARQSRELDQAIDDYGRVRARERNAVAELRRLQERLDEGLADPNVSLSYLTDLEAELSAARATACSILEDTARARQQVYDGMQRLANVAREFERQTDLFGKAQLGLDGMWHLEVQPLDVVGLTNLRVSGSAVSGPYRLSNGNQGSFRGTLAGDRLRLEVIDAERGVIADIEARVDTVSGRLHGTWQAREMGSGLPSRGEWQADKVSSREEIDLDF